MGYMVFCCRTSLFWCVFILFSACQQWKREAALRPTEPSERGGMSAATAAPVKDQILLLSFELRPDSAYAGRERCVLMSSRLFEGRFKKAFKTEDHVEAGDLICHFYDIQGNLLSAHIEEDPLTAPVEAAEEDGTLKRHFVVRDRAELVLRVQRTPDLHHLTIGKVMPDQTVITLASFQL